MESEALLKKRIKELADKAYRTGIYTFTGFLGMSELSEFYETERELSFVGCKVYGGYEGSERCMLRFGREEEFGYEEAFPIVCLKVRPLMQKFADNLGNRDFLGALMNLVIERSTLGDIVLKENVGYLFCTEAIAPFIIENLTKVKHTSVLCEVTQEALPEKEDDLTELKIQVASERIDSVISKVYKLSRSESVEYFRQKKVFVKGRLCENTSYFMKEKDVVTVRGFGKFIFDKLQGYSKKGKQNVTVLCFGERR